MFSGIAFLLPKAIPAPRIPDWLLRLPVYAPVLWGDGLILRYAVPEKKLCRRFSNR